MFSHKEFTRLHLLLDIGVAFFLRVCPKLLHFTPSDLENALVWASREKDSSLCPRYTCFVGVQRRTCFYMPRLHQSDFISASKCACMGIQSQRMVAMPTVYLFCGCTEKNLLLYA